MNVIITLLLVVPTLFLLLDIVLYLTTSSVSTEITLTLRGWFLWLLGILCICLAMWLLLR